MTSVIVDLVPFIGTWSAGTFYLRGSCVLRTGVLYQAGNNNSGNDPAIGTHEPWIDVSADVMNLYGSADPAAGDGIPAAIATTYQQIGVGLLTKTGAGAGDWTGGGDVPTLDVVLAAGNNANDLPITGLAAPTEETDAATKDYVDTAVDIPTPFLAAVLFGTGVDPETADGNDTGGVEIVHVPAVDVNAHARFTATASGSGDADVHALAIVVDGSAFAGPRAEASGSGHTDACAYARSVDGDALADNDAAASGTGYADAGGYAVAVDGNAFSGGMATTTGSGNADASDIATANTGFAAAGSLAVRQAVSAGMSAIVDGTSARMAFNGTTPIAIPVLPATPDAQDIADVLVALGLCTQAV